MIQDDQNNISDNFYEVFYLNFYFFEEKTVFLWYRVNYLWQFIENTVNIDDLFHIYGKLTK